MLLFAASLMERYVEKTSGIAFEWGIDETAQNVLNSLIESLSKMEKWLVYNQPQDDLEVQRFIKKISFSMY